MATAPSQCPANFRPMSVSNTGFLLDRMGEDCHQLQFLRELTQNGIEAIDKIGGKGSITWDVHWHTQDLEGTTKICVIDTGVGMSGKELVKYINQLSSSGAEQSLQGNYGLGAKIATATRNHNGVVYMSWKDGVGSMIYLKRDAGTGAYGLELFEKDDGTYDYFVEIDDSLKPEEIEDHGTVVVLRGNSPSANTMRAPKGAPAASRWVSKFLNSRYFEIPAGITIRAREGWEYPRTDVKRNKLRTIVGQRKYLDDHSIARGTTPLSDATAWWWILEDSAALTQHSNYVESAGHVAALYQNELYEMVTGNQRNSRLQEFGVIFGCRQVVLYIQPHDNNSSLTTNAARTQLLIDQAPLPWSDWAAEFRENLPKELEEFVENKGLSTKDKDHAKAIRDRLKDILGLYKVTRYRPDKSGTLTIDEDNSATGGRPSARNRSVQKNGKPKESSSGGTNGNIYSLFQKRNGSPGARVQPDLIPDVIWVSVNDGSREPDDLDDRAAKYIAAKNLVLANADFRVFTDMISHWHSQLGGKPNTLAAVEDEVRNWFEQALIETVIGVQALRNSKKWPPDQIEAALSEEALTAAVVQRWHINNQIKRNLHRQFKSLITTT